MGGPNRYLTYIQSLPPGDRNFRSSAIIFINEEDINKLIKNSLNIDEYSLYILNENNDVITSFNNDDVLYDIVTKNKYEPEYSIKIKDKNIHNKGKYRFFTS